MNGSDKPVDPASGTGIQETPSEERFQEPGELRSRISSSPNSDAASVSDLANREPAHPQPVAEPASEQPPDTPGAQPLLNVVETPAAESDGDPASPPETATGGGGKKVPPSPHLTAVGDSDSPEPPGGADDPDREQRRLENDGIRADNESKRATTKVLEREVDSETKIAEAESAAKNKGSETDREDRHAERYAAWGLVFIGVGVSAFLNPFGGVPLITFGGARLRALTPNKRPVFSWKRKQSDEPETP